MIDPVTLTQEQIRFKSITPADEGAQAHLISVLKPMGFTIYDLPFEGNGGTYPVKNFFARRGTTGPHMCYAGHTDVVPPGDVAAWTHGPFSGDIVDGKIYGRGSADMKSGNCAFIAAVSRFLADTHPNGSISLLITGDEEAESVNGTEPVLKWMAAGGHIPDVCIVGEPSNPKIFGESVRIGRRGSLSGKLTVTGKQGHVAYPHLADNPMPRLIQMLAALNAHTFDTGSEFFPPTNLEVTSIDVGNPTHNVIPAAGAAHFNIRFGDTWNSATLGAKVREILDSVGPYDLKLWGNAESFVTKPGPWTELVLKVIEEKTGIKPQGNTGGGTSDARFISRYCPVVEFGVLSQTIHQVDEHTTVEHVTKLTDIFEDILRRYFA